MTFFFLKTLYHLVPELVFFPCKAHADICLLAYMEFLAQSAYRLQYQRRDPLPGLRDFLLLSNKLMYFG